MSNEIATQDENVFNALQSSLYPGAEVASIKMVLAYCKAANLDPMTKPVHIVPIWDSKANRSRDVVMPGIGLYRIQASRTGCAGISEPEFGPTATFELGGHSVTYPEWCKITVKRRLESGEIVDFTAKELWLENYAVKGGKEKSIAPNAMWQKRPYGQLAKCAEAQALRKAFPEIGSAPTAEEMEGKSFYIEEDAAPKISLMPVAKPKDEPAIVEAEFTETGEIGIHLSDAQKRILFAKAAQVGLDEEALINRFTHISLKNWNTVIKEIGEMQSA